MQMGAPGVMTHFIVEFANPTLEVRVCAHWMSLRDLVQGWVLGVQVHDSVGFE